MAVGSDVGASLDDQVWEGAGDDASGVFHEIAAADRAAGRVGPVGLGIPGGGCCVGRGGGAENAVVIIDPSVPESLYVGHYYARARNIPPQNILYMPAGASDFKQFVGFQRDALLGMLSNRGIDDHIDFSVVVPGTNYFVSARGLVKDGCSAVTRFSATSVYVFSHIAESITPNTSVSRRNQYYSSTKPAMALDSNVAWRLGEPSKDERAERYFVSGMLGYSGQRGNTIEEVISLIDRSVAVDGTRPEGTFYFVRTTDNLRSAPRHGAYAAAVRALDQRDGKGEQLDCKDSGCNANTVLPQGKHDILGVMTGWAKPDIDGTDMTILPGAVGDHLTSFAGHFDTASQTKMSRWIAKGASGSFGTVEEPCNYSGKFPHPTFHVNYFDGLTLGEAGLRSLSFLPWQVLTYGDPLTQPFAYLPDVKVPDAPKEEVSGKITLSPEATTEHPFARIGGFDLFVNGIKRQTIKRNKVFELDTADLPDGPNDLRVIAFDNSDVRAQHRFVAGLLTNNHGLQAAIKIEPRQGDRSTLFRVEVSADGGAVSEIVVLVNQRVLASTQSDAGVFKLWGETIGAGPVLLQARAVFDDGRIAISQPVRLDIAFKNPPDPGEDSEPPVAFGYTRTVLPGKPMLLELPGTDVDDPNLRYTIVSGPEQGTLTGSGPVRLLKTGPRALGADRVTFKVTSQGVDSNVAIIDLNYPLAIPCESIKKLKAGCKRGKIKGLVKLTNKDHHKSTLTISIDEKSLDINIKKKKAKFSIGDQAPGEHTVALIFPPDCKPPKKVKCE